MWELSMAGVNPKQRWTEGTRHQASTAVAAVALSPFYRSTDEEAECGNVYNLPSHTATECTLGFKTRIPAVQNTHSDRLGEARTP